MSSTLVGRSFAFSICGALQLRVEALLNLLKEEEALVVVGNRSGVSDCYRQAMLSPIRPLRGNAKELQVGNRWEGGFPLRRVLDNTPLSRSLALETMNKAQLY